MGLGDAVVSRRVQEVLDDFDNALDRIEVARLTATIASECKCGSGCAQRDCERECKGEILLHDVSPFRFRLRVRVCGDAMV
jgi:hypothetical protein